MDITKEQIKLFRALSDDQRMKLFQLICTESRLCNLKYDEPPYHGNCVSQLKKKTKLSQSTISHHISLLETAGLVRREKIGKWEYLFPITGIFSGIEKFISDVKEGQKVQTKFFETVKVENTFGEKGFKELLSLVSNHEYRKIYKTNRQNSLTAYMKDPKTTDQIYTLIYNPETSVIGVHIVAYDGQKADIELAGHFTELIHKYLPTIKNV
jgi:DNA-binding transcriptional ArsR family regulator